MSSGTISLMRRWLRSEGRLPPPLKFLYLFVLYGVCDCGMLLQAPMSGTETGLALLIWLGFDGYYPLDQNPALGCGRNRAHVTCFQTLSARKTAVPM